nr:AF211533_1 Avr9/Cf-9 rapidly elicited protein 146 [Ipomoea batatas]
MEPSNFPVVAKKFWSFVRTALLMLRKGIISKTKLMLDINLVLKRGKIAGKTAIHNLMLFHHAHHLSSSSTAAAEYEFSCRDSPAYHLPFSLHKKSKHHHAPPTYEDILAANAVVKALEILHSETASPALPGFGRTPVVRQLRITDSPFPIREAEENDHVNEAAEAFISKFYNTLRRQSAD